MNKTFSEYVLETLEDEGCTPEPFESIEECEIFCDAVMGEGTFEEYKESYEAYCAENGIEPNYDFDDNTTEC